MRHMRQRIRRVRAPGRIRAPGYVAVGGLDPLQTTQAIKEIILDPALPRIINHLLELNKLEQKPGGPHVPGIGLRHVEQPLKAYIWVRKNPWAFPVGIAALLGIPFLLGYFTGGGGRQ